MSFITISLDASEIAATKEALGNLFDNKGLSAILAAALKKAVEPGKQALVAVTPVGPTGNLKRAIATKVKPYPKDGGAVGLVGYEQSQREAGTALAGPGSVRLGKKRGFHQWWLEFGTKERVIKNTGTKPYERNAHTRRMKSGKVANVSAHTVQAGQGASIASSWNKRGEFGLNEDGSTDQPYAFFKKGKKGQVLRLPAVQPGGVSGVPPLRTAYERSRGQMAQILQQELAISLEAALDKITRSSTGTITGVIGG